MISIFVSIFLFAVWSSIFCISKLSLQYSSPVFITAIRMLLAAFLLLGYVFFTNRSSLRIKKKQLLAILLLALFSIYLTNIFEFWGLQYLSSSKTCFIYSLSPFFTAFFSFIHFKEKMNIQKWIGLGIGFLGTLPIIIQQTEQESFMGGLGFFSWPALSIVAASIFSVYGWILLRVLIKNEDTSPLIANGYSMLLGGLLAFFHSLLADTWLPAPVAANKFLPLLQLVIIVTFLSNILCYNLYGVLLKKLTATLLSFIGTLSPFFASLFGWLLLGEKPSILMFSSTGIIMLGLYLVYQAEIKQGYIEKTQMFSKSG